MYCAGDHGSELEAVEWSAVQALAFVSEKDGAGGIEFDAQGNYGKYRCKQEENDRRKKQVFDSFSASSVGQQRPGAVIVFCGAGTDPERAGICRRFCLFCLR